MGLAGEDRRAGHALELAAEGVRLVIVDAERLERLRVHEGAVSRPHLEPHRVVRRDRVEREPRRAVVLVDVLSHEDRQPRPRRQGRRGPGHHPEDLGQGGARRALSDEVEALVVEQRCPA
jgi:hypothetical protein